jgi:hypothetical protein
MEEAIATILTVIGFVGYNLFELLKKQKAFNWLYQAIVRLIIPIGIIALIFLLTNFWFVFLGMIPNLLVIIAFYAMEYRLIQLEGFDKRGNVLFLWQKFQKPVTHFRSNAYIDRHTEVRPDRFKDQIKAFIETKQGAEKKVLEDFYGDLSKCSVTPIYTFCYDLLEELGYHKIYYVQYGEARIGGVIFGSAIGFEEEESHGIKMKSMVLLNIMGDMQFLAWLESARDKWDSFRIAPEFTKYQIILTERDIARQRVKALTKELDNERQRDRYYGSRGQQTGVDNQPHRASKTELLLGIGIISLILFMVLLALEVI